MADTDQSATYREMWTSPTLEWKEMRVKTEVPGKMESLEWKEMREQT